MKKEEIVYVEQMQTVSANGEIISFNSKYASFVDAVVLSIFMRDVNERKQKCTNPLYMIFNKDTELLVLITSNTNKYMNNFYNVSQSQLVWN